MTAYYTSQGERAAPLTAMVLPASRLFADNLTEESVREPTLVLWNQTGMDAAFMLCSENSDVRKW